MAELSTSDILMMFLLSKNEKMRIEQKCLHWKYLDQRATFHGKTNHKNT